MEVGPLVVSQQLHASVPREGREFLHEGHNLEAVEKESDQGLVKHVLLLRELPPQQRVRDENEGVFEGVLLVAHEVVTGMVVAGPRLGSRSVAVGEGWPWHLGFRGCEHLRLQFDLLMDDLFDDANQDMNHDQLTVEVAPKPCQQDPLEP